jgi:hypothetical protein
VTTMLVRRTRSRLCLNFKRNDSRMTGVRHDGMKHSSRRSVVEFMIFSMGLRLGDSLQIPHVACLPKLSIAIIRLLLPCALCNAHIRKMQRNERFCQLGSGFVPPSLCDVTMYYILAQWTTSPREYPRHLLATDLLAHAFK